MKTINILKSYPEDNSSDVNPESDILIITDTKLKYITVNKNNVLVLDSNRNVIDVDVFYEHDKVADNGLITIKLKSALEGLNDYTCILRGLVGIQDQPLIKPEIRFSFKTAKIYSKTLTTKYGINFIEENCSLQNKSMFKMNSKKTNNIITTKYEW